MRKMKIWSWRQEQGNVKLLSAIFPTWAVRADDVYHSIDGCTLAKALQKAIDNISTVKRPRDLQPSFITRYKRVLTLRYGLEDGNCRTLKEIGMEFNLTRERIRQIEAKALRLLRHPSRSTKLKAYIGSLTKKDKGNLFL